MYKIEAKNLVKVYQPEKARPVYALENLNLKVKENEFLAVVGPSGCGKSTFLYLVAGFLDISEGEIFMDGRAIRGIGTDRGIVFQHFALFPWKTVKGNISYGLEEKRIPKEKRNQIVNDLIHLVHLEGFENSYPMQLSGGMKQRVATARTLALDPEVLLMDEPFGALDAQTRGLMQVELLEVYSKKKKTVVFVTHDVREAVLLADRVAIMTARPGRVKKIIETKLDTQENFEETLESQEFIELTNAIRRIVKEEVDKTGI